LGSFSAFHSRFFARRSSSQKELRSSRAARDSVEKSFTGIKSIGMGFSPFRKIMIQNPALAKTYKIKEL